ncbi:MAG TPA: ABC transporter ATP-binding protein [Thermoplasmataceae archaeon]|nr:ABC transporter ATP-binding protein [Thermoplasmataceae archaeon]
MTVPLESVDLRKTYRYKGRENLAISNFTFTVRRSMIFSLLGRNGSGKTTFVKIATTQLEQDSGTVRVFGKDIKTDADEIRSMTSLVPQESRPFPHLTPREHVYYYQRMLGNTREGAKDSTDYVCRLLDMDYFADKECVNLSGGQKQLTMVAISLSADAQIYFLDEPTIGLDVITRRKVWEAIQKFKEKGKTIILTTHYLDEAAALSDEIAIVSYGTLVRQGTLDGLRSALSHDTRVFLPGVRYDQSYAKFGESQELPNGLLLYTDRESVDEILAGNMISKSRIEVGPVGLDDVFISLVGEQIEGE